MRNSTWRVVFYALILLIGFITALPNLLSPQQLAHWPSFLPSKQLSLGLDLRGGSLLVLEIDTAEMIHERLDITRKEISETLNKAAIQPRTLQTKDHSIVITLNNAQELQHARSALNNLTNKTVETPGNRPAPEYLETTPDDHTLTITLSDDGIRNRVDASAQQSLEIIRSRIDQIGIAEPTIQRIGADRVLVQLPGVQNPAQVRQLLGSTAKLGFYLVQSPTGQSAQNRAGLMTLKGKDGQTYIVARGATLTGEHLTDAHAGFDSQTQRPVVNFRFDTSGAKQLADITSRNIGRPLAIVLDQEVLSAPIIQSAITGGAGQISGNFTVADTVTLSALLRAGSLPAPMTVIEERTVGPDLGADSIRMGLYTGAIGFALVVALMIFLYGRWGLIANLALGLNVMLTIGVLSVLGATLTLPGIAGIILGIGLAVDANVLINERIREETKKGLSAFMALDAGFKRAYATIVDSNITTLIATCLLFEFGSGPVRGFAITMSLGILISMFTAVAVVRVIMSEIVWRKRLKKLVIEPLFAFMPEKTSFSFMRARFLGIAVSLVLSTISVGLFFKPGLNYGVDFKGGIQIELASPEQGSHALANELPQLRSTLSHLDLGEVNLQEVGKDGHVLLRLARQPGGEEAQTKAVDTVKSAIQKLDPQTSFSSSQVVGAKVSGELATSGATAVILAIVAMLVYIWWRFEWPFAVGAIVTLLLDITKTVGFFAIMGLDFNLTAIAALLTLIGYSVNDKVVVYDRMRENLRLFRKMPMREIIDMSINQSLARCVFTSLTTLLAILPMAISGGSAVESFAVPMVFGVAIATTSSIFIAAPILLFLDTWRRKQHAKRLNSSNLPDNRGQPPVT
ncbi:protein translocase subunit SecD [Thalassospira sp. TSL5-1]|uniref:protein translocase subunit SecD n=1 Tax=Thalassospira sp. TSL5-1 TaxID=1544451 RepID=UPI000938E0BA|nr:protein translocase subunit SecD [Thalassospira sp. TSL5-1]OKH87190.1 preprotein translocase subunit SecD/SecF [Thalassospira sp. TSL5-1]